MLLLINSISFAQKRLFSQSAPVTDRELYSRLQSISVTNVSLFQFEPDIVDQEALSVDLNGVAIIFNRVELDERKDGYTWFGRDADGNSIVLTYRNSQLAGKLYYNSVGYTISPFDKGTVALYRKSGSELPATEHPQGQSNQVEIPMSSNMKLLGDGVVKLRVLIAFTSSAESGASSLGYSDMKLFLQQAISETNLTFVNSNVAHRVRLASGIRVSYSESGVSWSTTLSRFQGTSDGYMDEIHTYRNNFSADVCALIVNDATACGLASSIGSTATTAFCAADYRCILGNNTLGHEIGHLHGCRHNPEADPAITPYAYGHGYRNDIGGWRTVMSYECSPSCPRLPYWSNPDIYYFGSPMGTAATHDNARVLDLTAASLAAYRTAPSSLTLTSSSSLIDDEYGEAIATSQITMQDDFEVSINSEFYAYAASDAGDIDYAPFRIAVGEKEIVSVDEVFAKELLVYPNPAISKNKFVVRYPHENRVSAQLVDNGGRPVKITYKYSGEYEIEINLPETNPGLYYLKLRDGKAIHTSKVLISK